MKTSYVLIAGLIVLAGHNFVRAQVEIKGSGNTGATSTLITTNTTPDTTIFIRDDGNIGIGTTHPQTKLDVNGRINASNGYRFPDATVQMTAALNTHYQNVVTVAQAGGDFTFYPGLPSMPAFTQLKQPIPGQGDARCI